MKIGIVFGVVWATRKVKEIDGCRMYLVQPVSSDDRIVDEPLVVADPKRIAAPGDKVVYVTSTDASQAFDSGFAPVNASIVELVDVIA
ncbi:EutN/CcmL family microcompartment protein [Rosettibacter firmus]|uniref:EutN/CcmL family microcompartment protein n=1 Tax=Rosettibacter firmus TaxID=3111522 RepID=UPI00336BD986